MECTEAEGLEKACKDCRTGGHGAGQLRKEYKNPGIDILCEEISSQPRRSDMG